MGKMVIRDRVYGKVTIESSLIGKLIKSAPLRRLKGIAQYGVPDRFYHLKGYSRFEHSLGVMILLQILSASEEEQIAGLLHDISHTAFSHVVDWVIGSGHIENFQDDKHQDFIKSSEIGEILKRYNLDPERISDLRNFKLLDSELPELCADRIDYALREFSLKTARICLKSLTAKDGKIVFKNKAAARLFARNFLRKQMDHWGGFEAASRYRIFADLLKIALEKKVLNFTDFWQDDKFIVKKLLNSKDRTIINKLSILRNKNLKGFPLSGTIVHKKFRFVDPEFIYKDKLVRLSLADPKFKKELEDARIENDRGINVPQI